MLDAIQLCRHSRHVCDGWVQRAVVLMGKSITNFNSLQTIQDLVLEGVPGRDLIGVSGSFTIFLDDVANIASSLRTSSEKTGEGETAGEEEALLWRNSDSISSNSPGIDRSTLGETRQGSFFLPELKPREDAKRELLYRARVIGTVVGVSDELEEAAADSNFS